MDRKTFEDAISTASHEIFGAEGGAIDHGANLEDSGLDSLQMGNFLLAFEEAAGFQLPEQTIDQMWEATTFGEVIRILLAASVDETANK